MNTQAPSLIIDGILIPVTPHPEHEYTLTTAQLAVGYEVSPKTIRNHKSNHSDELVEGKHFFGAQNMGSENLMDMTLWTKRGIIRLGFFIKSERAKRFRDMAEDLCLREWEQPGNPITLEVLATLREFATCLASLAERVSALEAERRSPHIALGNDLDSKIAGFQIRSKRDVGTYESMLRLQQRLLEGDADSTENDEFLTLVHYMADKSPFPVNYAQLLDIIRLLSLFDEVVQSGTSYMAICSRLGKIVAGQRGKLFHLPDGRIARFRIQGKGRRRRYGVEVAA